MLNQAANSCTQKRLCDMLRTEHQVNVSMNQTADMRLINGIYADTLLTQHRTLHRI